MREYWIRTEILLCNNYRPPTDHSTIARVPNVQRVWYSVYTSHGIYKIDWKLRDNNTLKFQAHEALI